MTTPRRWFGIARQGLPCPAVRGQFVCPGSGVAGCGTPIAAHAKLRLIAQPGPTQGSTQERHRTVAPGSTRDVSRDAVARDVGFGPFPCPPAITSGPYLNPLGVQMGQCTYCEFCEWFGCANYSNASPKTTILPVLYDPQTA